MSDTPVFHNVTDSNGVVYRKAPHGSQKDTGTILIVEDSRTQADYLRAILESEGYHTVLAMNGCEALEQIAVVRPMMVLTDIIMPGMDGYELCCRIKQDKKSSDIPVILVTRLFNPEDVIKGLASGADDFIIKPFEPDYIHSRIRAILSHLEKPDPDELLPVFEVTVANTTYVISASRLRIFNILLSTYEAAINNNQELQDAHEQLNAFNEELVTSNEQLVMAANDLKNSNLALEQENAERKRVEKALAEANKKLNLLSSITRHDINNQLLILNGYVELLHGEIPNPSLEEYFSHIAKASSQITAMIRFTKDYEKIGIRVPVWQDLSALANSAEKGVIPDQVTIKNDLPPGIEVFADPLIVKVFFNLIDNAIRHGGDRIATIRFSFEACNADRIIVCEDDGAGVAPEDKEKIFSRGFGKNTGFGLSICREILDITGISITENGEPGKGARFEMVVPPDKFQKTV
ncbi:MAG: hybrid sensor histidine kinase/response regulator [Methanoregula sp.]|nr:hybrid sensor histidine kinase/response regulator [Methanoregula sp.]